MKTLIKQLAVISIFSLLAIGQTARAQFTYGVSGSGTSVMITGYSGSDTDLVISGTLGGLPVTEIANYAFTSRHFTSITFPPGLQSIGDFSFYDTLGLMSVTIPQGVTTFGVSPFSHSLSLTSIDVDSANPAYSSTNGVLFDKSQTTLIECPAGLTGTYTVPASVTAIEYYAFYEDANLSAIILPPGLISIGSEAFASCNGITSLSIPALVTTIGPDAFLYMATLTSISVAPTNPNYSSQDGVLFNKDKTQLLAFPMGKSGDYVVPGMVTTIGADSFYGCVNLTTVSIPASVALIGSDAFDECSALTLIQVDSANTNYKSVNGVLFDKAGTNLILYPLGKTGFYTMPDGVVTIGTNAFNKSTGLTGITLPQTLQTIGVFAFYGTNLPKVIIPTSVTSLGDNAFGSCTGLLDIQIPPTISTISHHTFTYCTNLPAITIPASVTSLGDYTFFQCPKLKTVLFSGSAPTLGTSTFYNLDPGATFYYFNDETGFPTPTWNGYPTVAIGRPVVSQVQPNATTSRAGLADSINPAGNDLAVYYQFGTTTAYELGATGAVSIGSGTSPVLVSSTLTGLTPGANYHVQAVMTGTMGSIYGPDQTFATVGMAHGNYQVDVAGIWDLSGTYSGTLSDGYSMNFTLVEDHLGKFTGLGTFAYTGTTENWAGSISAVSGMIKTSGTVPSISMTFVLSGAGTIATGTGGATDPATMTGSVAVSFDLDEGSTSLKTMKGTAKRIAVDQVTKKKSSKSEKIHSGDTFNLPGDVTGDSTLKLSLAPNGIKYSGTGSLQTSTGQSVGFTPTGIYKAKAATSSVSLKAAGGNSLSLVITTSGTNQMTVNSAKGKAFGQTINYKEP